MKVLFLTTVLPQGRQIGSEVASQAVIDGLRHSGAEVDVLGYLRVGQKAPDDPHTIVVGERYIETRQAKWYPLFWMAASLLKGRPYSAAKYVSANYVREVKQRLAGGTYGMVVIDHPQMGWLAQYVPAGVRLVFVAHNVENQMYRDTAKAAQSFAGRWLYTRESFCIEIEERRLAAAASEIWTLTRHDADFFRGLPGTATVREVPIPAVSRGTGARSKRYDIGIIGSWSWHANREGLQWFLDQVYPLLDGKLRLAIAGKGADELKGRYPNVDYLGFVPDAVEFMEEARVMAIPTLSGGGIQIKTLDAIGSGTAIVATPCAVRGIERLPAGVRVAESPQQFSETLGRVLSGAGDSGVFAESIAWSMEREQRFRAEIATALSVSSSPASLAPAA